MTLTKRRSVLLLVLALCMALVAPVTNAIGVRDVPEGHWAYEAVRTLVEKGYLPVGEDQLFRGNEPTDRYTLATVVAKMMAEIESGRVSTTPEDVGTLRSLTDELRADLVQYYADVQRMEGQVAGAHEKLTAYDERLVQVIGELGTLYRRATAIEEMMESHRIEGREAMQVEARQLQQRLEALGDSFAVDLRTLRTDLDGVSELLDVRSYELSAADAALKQQIQALSDSLRAEASSFRDETSRLSDRLDEQMAELEDRINVSFNQHGLQLAGQATDTQQRIAGINEQLTALEVELEAKLAKQDQAVQRQLASIAEELAIIEEKLQRTAVSTDERLVSVDQAFAEVRQALNSHTEVLAAYEMLLDQVAQDLASQEGKLTQQLQGQGEALGRVQGQLVTDVEKLRQTLEQTRLGSEAIASRTSELEDALRTLEAEIESQVVSLQRDNESLGSRVDDVRREMLILESQIGLSEEQVAELTQRVREEMAEQLTLSLVREGELQRGFAELRKEFDSYRETSEAELKSARGAQAMSIGALVLGVIALVK